MAQRGVPSAPAWDRGYTISTIRPNANRDPVFEVVADNLQRLFVTMPSKRTDAGQIDATIRAALGALYRPPDPVR